MRYDAVPVFNDLEEFSLVPRLKKSLVPLNEEVLFRKVFLQNNIISAFIIAERIAQLVSVSLGSDDDQGSNAGEYDVWEYDPET